MSNNPFAPPPQQPGQGGGYQYANLYNSQNPFQPSSSSQPGPSLSVQPTGSYGGPPSASGFRPTSSFGQQLEAQLNAQPQQQPMSYGAPPQQQQQTGYGGVQDLDPFGSLGAATWAQQQPSTSNYPSSPNPYGGGGGGQQQQQLGGQPPTPQRGDHPKKFVQAHRVDLEAWDPVTWKRLTITYKDLKNAWDERKSLIMRALDGNLGPHDGQRAQDLMREADMQIDSIVAAEYQLKEAQEGWRHSTDAASKRRVREQLNSSLRSLPDWPEVLDAQRLAEQANNPPPPQPQQQQPQPTGYGAMQPQPTGYGQQPSYGMQPQQTGYQQYGQPAPMQRPAFTGYPQTELEDARSRPALDHYLNPSDSVVLLSQDYLSYSFDLVSTSIMTALVNAAAGLAASLLTAYATSPPAKPDETDQRSKESWLLTAATIITAPASFLAFVGPNIVQLALAYAQYTGVRASWVPRGDLSGLSGLEWTGIALQAAGAVMRVWCFRVLGRYFTFQVTIRKEHKLIRAPPYSHLRHPSYTGITAVAIGTLLRLFGQHSALVHSGYVPPALRTPAAFALAMIVHAIVLTERIRGEEKALQRAFPDEWEDYRRSTWRLVPYLL